MLARCELAKATLPALVPGLVARTAGPLHELIQDKDEDDGARTRNLRRDRPVL